MIPRFIRKIFISSSIDKVYRRTLLDQKISFSDSKSMTNAGTRCDRNQSSLTFCDVDVEKAIGKVYFIARIKF